MSAPLLGSPTMSNRRYVEPLTERQREILGFIEREIRRGAPPAIRDICDRFDIASVNGVNDHLKALERKGCLQRSRQRSRSFRLTARGLAELGLDLHCPTCGRSRARRKAAEGSR